MSLWANTGLPVSERSRKICEVELKTDRLSAGEIDHRERSAKAFQKVPHPMKLFRSRDVARKARRSVGVGEIPRQIGWIETSALHIVRVVDNWESVEGGPQDNSTSGKGPSVCPKGRTLGAGLVDTVHPYLDAVYCESGLSSLLVLRRGMHAVIVDKAEANGTNPSYRLGALLPLFVGAAGKTLLCQISRAEYMNIFRKAKLPKLTSNVLDQMTDVREAVIREREGRVIGYMEERTGGVVTLAVPMKAGRADLQAALLAVGLKRLWKGGRLFSVSKRLTEIAAKIHC